MSSGTAAGRRTRSIGDRLLARSVPRPAAAGPDSIDILIFHGSRDNINIPSRKLRTLPFTDTELAAQGFDYAAIGHYHEHAVVTGPGGRVIGAYAGCPAGRGLDETGDKFVLAVEIRKEAGVPRVSLETIRLDTRTVRRIDVSCFGATHRDALLRRIDEALAVNEPTADDMVQVRLTGRVAPGIDIRLPEGLFEDRYFHVSFDTSSLKPDYNLDRYREERLRTTEARFAREMLRRIEAETDPERRRILENALYYGLDALIQKEVSPRYEDSSS